MRYLLKILMILKQHGFITGSVIIKNLILNKLKNRKITQIYKNDVIDFYKFITFKQNAPALTAPLSSSGMSIAWFIPDMGIGSGGHTTIFRMINNLEKLGVKSDIIFCGGSRWGKENEIKKVINNHFFKLDANVYIVNTEDDLAKLSYYDISMATSWETAYYVNNFAKCYKKSYFVQDYEPYFYERNSSYTFAEQTYKFGFYGITAGSWLSNKLKEKYDMECTPFSFSYDKHLYKRTAKRDKHRRIFFYARPPTGRRAFELGLLVLNKVYEKFPDIHVIFAGWDVSNYVIPYVHLNSGVVRAEELPDLFSQCDVSLVLSLTNLSLLPLELAAAGCPVVTNEGDNNSWIDPEKKLFLYAESTVESLANAIIEVLEGKISLDQGYIQKFLDSTSWIEQAETVKRALSDLLKN